MEEVKAEHRLRLLAVGVVPVSIPLAVLDLRDQAVVRALSMAAGAREEAALRDRPAAPPGWVAVVAALAIRALQAMEGPLYWQGREAVPEAVSRQCPLPTMAAMAATSTPFRSWRLQVARALAQAVRRLQVIRRAVAEQGALPARLQRDLPVAPGLSVAEVEAVAAPSAHKLPVRAAMAVQAIAW